MHNLTGYKCISCNKVFTQHNNYCVECVTTELTEFELSPVGNIHSWTTIHIPPSRYKDDIPYTVILVEMIDGIKVMGLLKEINEAKVGKKVLLSELDQDRGPLFSVYTG